MIRRISIVSLLCVIFHFASCVVFMDCGSERAIFKDVSVTECSETDERCALVRGTKSTIFVTLMSKSHISFVKAKARCKKRNADILFDVDNPLLCNYLDNGLQCPMLKNKEYNFNATMLVPLESNLFYGDVNIRWEFDDRHGRRILCIEFPGRLIGENIIHRVERVRREEKINNMREYLIENSDIDKDKH